MSDNPLAQITEGLTKPASDVAIALIDKIGDATGMLYEPLHIRRIAKAQAAAAKIQAESEIETTDLQQRTAYRLFKEETRHQKNMEDTTAKAVPQLNEDADPHAIEDDWIIKFFDKNRLVTDDEVQDLWASILAGEANRTGSYSSKTLTTFADMDRNAVMLFNTFCSLCIVYLEDPHAFLRSPSNFKIRDARVPIIRGSNTFSGTFQHGVGQSAQKSEAIYKRYGFGNDEFQLLLEHGLIQDVNTHTEYSSFLYNDEFWGFMKPSSTGREPQKICISGYSLSSVGKELFHITKRSNPRGHFELLINFLEECYSVNIDRALF